MSLRYEKPENTHGKMGLHKRNRVVNFCSETSGEYLGGITENIIKDFNNQIIWTNLRISQNIYTQGISMTARNQFYLFHTSPIIASK